MARVLARTVTHALVGLDPRRVEVEARLERAQPSFTIVGLADRACQEAKERVRSGIASAELEFPVRRITVNLAPAALRKEGCGLRPADRARRPRGVAAAAARLARRDRGVRRARTRRARARRARCARRGGGRAALAGDEARLRERSAPEVALAGVEPVPVFHLADAVAYLRGEYDPPPPDVPRQRSGARRARPGRRPRSGAGAARDRDRGRRRVTTSCSPGRPGTGKTMLARRLPGILPLLDDEDALEVTRIHSVAGVLEPGGGLIRVPPFRAPHHSSSMPAVIGGGGGGPRPGEASLAHRGVLFLDEFPEFARPVLESLRQPLEDGVVAVARVAGRALVPGALPARRDDEPLSRAARAATRRRSAAARRSASTATARRCPARCSTASTSSLTVPRPRGEELAGAARRALGRRPRARRRRARRGSTRAAPGARRAADELLTRAVERLPLSGRGRARVGRVAATIAALAGAERVEPEHLAEALSYRPPRELTE